VGPHAASTTLFMPSIGGDAANFWKTINADGNDRCPDTDRGIPHHLAMFPRSRAHMPWQNRIESDWDRTRRTDLTSMGMAAHKQIETAVCGLPVDFRGLRLARANRPSSLSVANSLTAAHIHFDAGGGRMTLRSIELTTARASDRSFSTPAFGRVAEGRLCPGQASEDRRIMATRREQDKTMPDHVVKRRRCQT
jgi:hypothetical protein